MGRVNAQAQLDKRNRQRRAKEEAAAAAPVEKGPRRHG